MFSQAYWRTLLVLVLILLLKNGFCLSSNCSWSTQAGTSRAVLASCYISLADLDPDSGTAEDTIQRSPYDPGEWIPVKLRPPGPWPQPLLLKELTLRLASCKPIWTVAEKACTFQASWTWPSAGLQAGPAFLFFRQLLTSTVVAQRLNLTCPPGDWEAMLLATTTSTATTSLSPCATATVSTGQQLLDALQQLQPGNARLLLTLAANISLPANPTLQRDFDSPDDSQPLVQIYRNVTLAGGGSADLTAGFNDDGTRVGTVAELNLRKRRNAFSLIRPTTGQQQPQQQPYPQQPVLVMADVVLVNSPPGPPSTWPLGLLTMFQYYGGLNRSGSAGLQLLSLRGKLVYNPGQIGYMAYWLALLTSYDQEDRKRGVWLREQIGAVQYVTDADKNLCSFTGMGDYFAAYNYTVTAMPLLTYSTPNDFDLWSLERPENTTTTTSSAVGGGSVAAASQQAQPVLPPSSFAVVANASQLLGLLQERWSGGPRVILVIANITLRPGQWPQYGAALSYNVSLVGPVTGAPVWLDLGFLPLVNPYNQSAAAGGAQQQSAASPPVVVVQLQRLRLMGLAPLLLAASRADVAAADAAGAFAGSLELVKWKDRCLQEDAITTGGGANRTAFLYDFRSCVIEVQNDIAQQLLLANSSGTCTSGGNRSTADNADAAAAGAAAGGSAAAAATAAQVATAVVCDLLLIGNNNTATGGSTNDSTGGGGAVHRLAPALRTFLLSFLAKVPMVNAPLVNISLTLINTTLAFSGGGGVAMATFQRCSLLVTGIAAASVPTESPSSPLPDAAEAGGGGVGAAAAAGGRLACATDSLLLAVYVSATATPPSPSPSSPSSSKQSAKPSTAVVVGIAVGGGVAALLFAAAVAAAVAVRHRRRRLLHGKQQGDDAADTAKPPPSLPAAAGCGGSDQEAVVGVQVSAGGDAGGEFEAGGLGGATATEMDGEGGGTDVPEARHGSPAGADAAKVIDVKNHMAVGAAAGGGGGGGGRDDEHLRLSMSLNFSDSQLGSATAAAGGGRGGRETMADMLFNRGPTAAAAAGPRAAAAVNVAGLMKGTSKLSGVVSQTPVSSPRDGGLAVVTAAATAAAGGGGNLKAVMNEAIEAMLRKCKATVAQASGPSSSSGGGSSQRRLQLLGRGAFGAVYLGVWRGIPAAIKVILFQAGDSDQRRTRVALEAALTSTLSHPNVVPTYHYEIEAVRAVGGAMLGTWAFNSGGAAGDNAAAATDDDHTDIAALQLRLAMQYCEGGTLSEALHTGAFGVPYGAGGVELQQRKTLASPQGRLPPPPSGQQQQQRQGHAATATPNYGNEAAVDGGSKRSQQAATEGAAAVTAAAAVAAVAARTADAEAAAEATVAAASAAAATATAAAAPAAAIEGAPATVADIAATERAAAAGATTAPPTTQRLLDWSDLAPALNMPLSLLAAVDVLRGLEYLHAHNIIHGDLTDNNVLLKAVQPVVPQPQEAPSLMLLGNRRRPASMGDTVRAAPAFQRPDEDDAVLLPANDRPADPHSKQPTIMPAALGDSASADMGREPLPSVATSKSAPAAVAAGSAVPQMARSASMEGLSLAGGTTAEQEQQEQQQRQLGQQQQAEEILMVPKASSSPLSPAAYDAAGCSSPRAAGRGAAARPSRLGSGGRTSGGVALRTGSASTPSHGGGGSNGALLLSTSASVAAVMPGGSCLQQGREPSLMSNNLLAYTTINGSSSASGTIGTTAQYGSLVDQQATHSVDSLAFGAPGGKATALLLPLQQVATQLLGYVFKISDLGLAAQLQGDTQSHLSNMMQGTPFFVAPEVMQEGRLSPAADIYSFGVVLWLLLHGISLRQLRHLLPWTPHVPIGPVLLRRASSELPPAARDLLRRCLEQQPGRRPTAAELLRDVEGLMRDFAGPDLCHMLLVAERREHFWPPPPKTPISLQQP